MKACVFGCGISGKGACNLLLKKGYKVAGIDRNTSLLNCEAIQNSSEKYPIFTEDGINLIDYQLLVVSPGIPKTHRLIIEARKIGLEVIGEIELGLRFLESYCIGVTGTNGKTTTSHLITHILNTNGQSAVCLGNSGVSLCDQVLSIKKDTIVVLELSSYQIEWIESKKIDLGFIINIEEDHLDRYVEFANYAKAKLRLLDFVSKCWVKDGVLNKFGLLSKKSAIFFDNEQIVATLKELGYTNIEGLEYENLFAAWQLTRGFVSKEGFYKSVCSFVRLEHRLEKFVKVNDMVVYNDSKSTNLASVIYALKKMPNKVVLMLGGADKGLSYTKILEEEKKIAHLICFGKAGKRLADQLSSLNPLIVSTVEEAAKLSLQKAGKGESILFSPGCSSFDAFKNYEERGLFFKKIMIRYLQEKKL